MSTPTPILYIEDNPDNRRVVRKTLKLRGYTVVEVETGGEGLAMARELMPPLILLDIGLPDMDGLQVLAHLKRDEALAHIPVIALTASAMVGDRERFLGAGCDDYLSKPLMPADLLEMIERHYPTNHHG